MPASESTSDVVLAETPLRIVSLVPSITETLVCWGLRERLVGRTRYCVEPTEPLAAVEVVGGTKNPDLHRIAEIRPDLVIVNREENRREDYEALVGAGIPVHVTHPRSVIEAADMLECLGARVGAGTQAAKLADRCRAAVAAAAVEAPAPPLSVFCPIWRNPWMTFGRHTYIGDMLKVAGMHNVCAAGAVADFFVVDLDEVRQCALELVLLPDEPYVFGPGHADEIRSLGMKVPIELLCGKDLAWYGPRTPGAVARLVHMACRVRTEMG